MRPKSATGNTLPAKVQFLDPNLPDFQGGYSSLAAAATALSPQLSRYTETKDPRRKSAEARRQQQLIKQRQKSMHYLLRWDIYREQKIENVTNYVRVLKGIRRLKLWITMFTAFKSIGALKSHLVEQKRIE